MSEPSDAVEGTAARTEAVMRVAAPVAKEVAEHLRPGEVVRLVPPADLAAGLKDGSLELLRMRSGDSAIIVDASSRDFAGHMTVKRNGQKVAGGRGAPILSPAVAWQLMAVATQQHYLAEIDAKLEGISERVRDLQDRMQHDQLGELLSIRAGLEDMQRRRDRGVPASAEDRLLLRKWMQEAEAVRYTALLNAANAFDGLKEGRKAFLQKDLGRLGSGTVLDFEIARLATEVQLGARQALLAAAGDVAELEHLLQDNAQAAERVLTALQDVAGRFAAAYARGLEMHSTPDLGDRFAKASEGRPSISPADAVFVKPITRGVHERGMERREAWLENFRTAAETPMTIAARDLAPTTPAALLVSRAEDGSVRVQIEP